MDSGHPTVHGPKEFEARVNTDPIETWLARLGDLIVRNISGLTLQTLQAHRRGRAVADRHVYRDERRRTFRSDGGIRTLADGLKGNFTANFLFLDGHVDARSFPISIPTSRNFTAALSSDNWARIIQWIMRRRLEK